MSIITSKPAKRFAYGHERRNARKQLRGLPILSEGVAIFLNINAAGWIVVTPPVSLLVLGKNQGEIPIDHAETEIAKIFTSEKGFPGVTLDHEGHIGGFGFMPGDEALRDTLVHCIRLGSFDPTQIGGPPTGPSAA